MIAARNLISEFSYTVLYTAERRGNLTTHFNAVSPGVMIEGIERIVLRQMHT